MSTPNHCPLCADEYETESDLRVHLEVQHRKSELARYLVEGEEEHPEPTVESGAPAPTA